VAGNRDLAEAVWEAGAVAVGWGGGEAHHRAKAMVREGRPGAAQALRSAARAARERRPRKA
jgi:hypothetical protein